MDLRNVNMREAVDAQILDDKLSGLKWMTLFYPENPQLTFLSDPENGEKILGKTAYYDPSAKEVTIYVDVVSLQ